MPYEIEKKMKSETVERESPRLKRRSLKVLDRVGGRKRDLGEGGKGVFAGRERGGG